MTSNELSHIHHIALVVADIKKSIRWYTSSFCCRVLSETPHEAVLGFANVRLSLVLPSHEQAHLAFLKDDASSFGELRERTSGFRSTFVADPTGNIIEIIDPESLL